MSKARTAILCLLLALLAACSGGPEKRIAVPPAPAGEVQNIRYRSVALREVSLPAYAATEEIFVEDDSGVLSQGDDLLWADLPSRAITLEMTRYLSQITNARVASEPWPFSDFPDAVVEIRIEEMVAGRNNVFRLSGQYFVASDFGRNQSSLFSLSVPIGGEFSAGDIAVARGQAVRDLARQIAERLRR